jgi:hypothetical protein
VTLALGTLIVTPPAAQATPILVTVTIGSDGSITFHDGSDGTTQVVADIAGYYLS